MPGEELERFLGRNVLSGRLQEAHSLGTQNEQSRPANFAAEVPDFTVGSRFACAPRGFTRRLARSKFTSPGEVTRIESQMAVERPDAAAQSRQVSSGAEESARLSALRSYRVLETGREARFDDLTCLASTICETPL